VSCDESMCGLVPGDGDGLLLAVAVSVKVAVVLCTVGTAAGEEIEERKLGEGGAARAVNACFIHL
jgi:hypothetical protein